MDNTSAPSARFANAEQTAVRYMADDGRVDIVMLTDDPRLQGLAIQDYAPEALAPAAAIEAAYQQRLIEGLLLQDGRAVWIDRESQGDIMAAVLGASLTGGARGETWWLKDGSSIAIPGTRMQAFGEAARDRYSALFQHRKQQLAALAAGETVDPAAGWPEQVAFDPAG
jgi:hypothetical protein